MQAEGIEQPYKLYTGSWHASTKAKYLGLSKDVFDSDSSFVMVWINKWRATITAMGDDMLNLKPEISRAAADITVGDESSVLNFIKHFGSHYVQEVQIGESVYQVFALQPEQYAMAKQAALGRGGSDSRLVTMSPEQFAEFQSTFLAPFAVREAGSARSHRRCRGQGKTCVQPNIKFSTAVRSNDGISDKKQQQQQQQYQQQQHQQQQQQQQQQQ